MSDNLITLFFIIQSELTKSQRERLISAMSLRGVQLPQFTYEAVKAQYHELFITTRTNPNIRPSGGKSSRTFYILEAGESEGEEGFWVEDEEGAEGFCPLKDEESFWQSKDHDALVLQKVKRRTPDEITTGQAYWGKKGSKNPWSNKGKGKSWNKSKDYKGKDSGKADQKGEGKTKTLPQNTSPRSRTLHSIL